MASRLLSELRNLPWRSIAGESWDRATLVAKFLCFLHFTNHYICGAALVYGPSMLPTLNLAGDIVLVERLSTRFEKIERGDIVLVHSPQNPKKIVAKRVTAMEGDRVTFLETKLRDRTQSVVVPKGHIWIQGDNVHASNDSRHFGAVSYGLLQGRAFFRFCGYDGEDGIGVIGPLVKIWPLEGFGSLGRGE